MDGKDAGKLTGNNKGIYVGESSRSMYERGKEHVKDGKDKAEDSHQWKHWAGEHPDIPGSPKFRLKIVSTFSDPMTRQLAEAVRIEMRGSEILNSRSEFSRCRVPRLRLELDNWKKPVVQDEDLSSEAREDDRNLMEDLHRIEEVARREGRKKGFEQYPENERKSKRKKLSKLVGWGEQSETDSSQQEGIQDWLVTRTPPPPSTSVQLPPTESRLQLETEKMLKEQEKKKDTNADARVPTFVFKKKGKITEEESVVLKKTHKDILTWVRKTKSKGTGWHP